MPNARRNLLIVGKLILFGIARVTTKYLIASVSSQQSRNAIGFCQTSTIISRDGGRITKGLIIGGCDLGQCTYDIFWRNVILMLLRPKMARRDSRILHLVVTFHCKPYRIGFCRYAGHFTKQSSNGATIGTSAQKSTAVCTICGSGHSLAQHTAKPRLKVGDGTGLLRKFHSPVGTN